MTDVREAILTRLEKIAGVEGVNRVLRNVVDPDESILPVVSIIEGDEEPSGALMPTRLRSPSAPMPVEMRPEVSIILARPAKEMGPDFNVLRAALIKAIMQDAEIILLTKGGGVFYNGMVSDIGADRLARMTLRFRFIYLLVPNHL